MTLLVTIPGGTVGARYGLQTLNPTPLDAQVAELQVLPPGTQDGQLLYYRTSSGLWVPTPTAPSDRQMAQWNATTVAWEFVNPQNLGSLAYFDLSFSPVGLWNFNQTAVDQTGGGNDLAATAGNLFYTDVSPGKAGIYVAQGSRIQTAAASATLQLRGDMTMAAIIQEDSGPLGTQVVARYQGNADAANTTNALYSMAFDTPSSPLAAAKRMVYFHEQGLGLPVTYTSGGSVSISPVHNLSFLGFTRIGNVVQPYVNGLPFGPASAVLTAPDGGNGASTRLFLGCTDPAATCAHPFICFTLQIIGSGLSAAQMKTMYNNSMGPAFGRLP